MRNSYLSGITGKEAPDLLIQLPSKTVFRIFHLKAQSGQVIADSITGSPILIGFGYHTLFQKHIHHFAESFLASASAPSLFFQPRMSNAKVWNTSAKAANTSADIVAFRSTTVLMTRQASNKWLMTMGEFRSSSIAS